MVEGEKDVETLRCMGLTAVSVPDGALPNGTGISPQRSKASA